MVHVQEDIDAMWTLLADKGGMTTDDMDRLRQAIVEDVQARHDLFIRARHDSANTAATQPAAPSTPQPTTIPWYRKLLLGDAAPEQDNDDKIKIAEETEPHVILRSISSQVYNELGKELERLPGLELKPGMERTYPLPAAKAACHVLGRLTRVDAGDLANDPYKGSEQRAYQPSDLIGRGGLEELCEPLLRGTRGIVEQWNTVDPDSQSTDNVSPDNSSDDKTAANREQVTDPIPGQDVRTTIDQDLELEIRGAFDQVNVQQDKIGPRMLADMHGAAVVIDVPTGEVRAMVSAPGFDPNMADQIIAQLNNDVLNHPLFNRATMAMLETGSTIKPVVGIGAITQGVMGLTDTIKCDGFLWIDGKKMPTGRCWTMSEFKRPGHVIPPNDPGPADGKLTFPDAIQRSCNVFFENMGDRLGIAGLSYWMRTFGLGRITGIGIPEARGRLPEDLPANTSAAERRRYSWFGGIGQGVVAATPLQMANVAATIARDGIWVRPHLIPADTNRQLRAIALAHPATQPSAFDWVDVPDRSDLHLMPAAVAAAQEGMWRVVNTHAGTGTTLYREDLNISAKTGSAQAARYWVPKVDADGQPILRNGRPVPNFLRPSTTTQPNLQTPWYLGFLPETDTGEIIPDGPVQFTHAWAIGFAPSHNPRIAFAVLVEYGGGGGKMAGPIANAIIAACIKHGYVSLDPQTHQLVQ
jgi:penicillin-binding protein 2